MADGKISADSNLASPASGDLIPIVDIDVADALKNKTITWSQITALSGGGGITWVYKDTSYTAVAGDGVLANISSGTITLPLGTLTVGDSIVVSNMHSSTLTVADNGNTIRYKGTSYTANVTLEQGETMVLVASTTGIWEIV